MMGNYWKEFFLTDIYEIRSGLSKPAKDFGSGYPFLAFKDVFNNTFIPEHISQLVQSSEKEQEGGSVMRGDVFLTRTSETMNELGMSCVALKDYPKATFNGFTKRLRPKDGINIIPEYVGYYLRSPKFRNEMLAFSTMMSTRASLNNDMIGRLKIEIPSINEQKSIAWILKSLDDKIELNRKMNETLEAMAQALFKSWFVDFDPVIDNALEAGNEIPDELMDRAEIRKELGDKRKVLPDDVKSLFPSEFEFSDEMGWVPLGWETDLIGNVVKSVGGATPSTKNKEFWDDGDIHWTTPKDLSGLTSPVLLDTARKITKKGLGKISSGLLPQYTFLMSSRAPVGYLAISQVPIAINQGYIAILPSEKLSSEYLLNWAHFNMDVIKGRASGTTFAEISKQNFRSISIFVPDIKIVKSFTDKVSFFYQRIAECEKQQTILKKQIDTLLPELLSGDFPIPDKIIKGFQNE